MSQRKQRRSLAQHLTVILVGVVSVIYLMNPTAGFIEFIPDALPLVGNLDEAGAVLLLLNALRFYGIDPVKLFGTSKQDENVIEGEYEEVNRPDDRY